MKRTYNFIAIIIFSVISLTAFAQNTDQAKQLIYHEKYHSAEIALHAILQNDINNEEAWYLLTQTYLEQHKVKAIKDSLAKAPQALLDRPLLHASLGQILMQENNITDAKQKFDLALKQTKEKDPAILTSVAKAYIDTKDADAGYAIELLEKAIKRDKKNPELYVLLGDAYSKLSNGSDAYSSYQKALNVDPNYARASYRLGKIFTAQKNPVYMQYFNEAIAADSLYAPALYEIYYHYYFRRDASKAIEYLKKYIVATDYNPQNDYLMTDILFLNKNYQAAIDKGLKVIKSHGNSVSPRIYKLISGSYVKLNDAESALDYMQKYFLKNTDTAYLTSDYESMGEIYETLNNREDSAARYYGLAAENANKAEDQYRLYKKISQIYSKAKEYGNEALWLQKYYTGNEQATNLDLFNWGLANYYAKQYPMADSVFAMYTEKYPDEKYGFYWRAKSNVAIDTAMELGLAIPYYLKVIEIAEQDTTDEVNRKRLIESYGYLASFKANHDKDFAGSIDYFEKVLSLQPDNEDAKRYVGILQKYINNNADNAKSAN